MRTLAPRDEGFSADGCLTIFYWCQETVQRRFETGIERVVRGLASKLSHCGVAIIPVGWDARSRQVVSLATGICLGGRSVGPIVWDRAILFFPEIALSLVGAGLDPFLLGRAYGLRTVGLVHDLIPIKLADDYPREAAALYRRYYRQFSAADLVLATTDYVAADLQNFLDAEGLLIPPIEVIPLPAELASVARLRTPPPRREARGPLKLVAVSTWEPRKNILRLLKAVGRVWADGHRLSLDLVGRRAGFEAYEKEVSSVANTLPTVRECGTISDADLVALYASCHASIYPSLEEGFGLPILESLWLGRPCLCHDGSSMAEIAPGGGTMLIDMSDEDRIVDALLDLMLDPDRIDGLARDAIDRPLRTWAVYAGDVLDLLASLGHGSRRRPGTLTPS